jgi:hypothetical protein
VLSSLSQIRGIDIIDYTHSSHTRIIDHKSHSISEVGRLDHHHHHHHHHHQQQQQQHYHSHCQSQDLRSGQQINEVTSCFSSNRDHDRCNITLDLNDAFIHDIDDANRVVNG